MEDPRAQERLEKWMSRLSKGEVGHQAEAEATKGLTLVKLLKGSVLCEFIVHIGVSDEHGKWQDGAMATLMDIVGGCAAFSVTSQPPITVSLSVSCYSKPNLQGSDRSRREGDGEDGNDDIGECGGEEQTRWRNGCVGDHLWMAPSHSSNNNKPLPSKL